MVSIYYEAVPEFNINLITEFNEGKGYQGIRIIKNLSLKMQEATSKVSRSLRKKKQYVRQIIYTNPVAGPEMSRGR